MIETHTAVLAPQRKRTKGRGPMSQSSGEPAHRAGGLPGKASLTDVAKVAGVSLGTASKALAGKPGVSDATRARVRQVADQLQYAPNPIAQTLALGRSDSIGLVTADLQGMFSSPIMVSAQRELSARGVTVLLANACGDARLERECVESLLRHNVGGLLIVDPSTNSRPPIQPDVPVPVVYAYAASSDPNDCSITSDNVTAGKIAVDHLLACGRRSIAIICGDVEYRASTERLKGSVSALADAGLEPVNIPRFGYWGARWGREETKRLIDSGVSFDGVICQSDIIAMGALDALKAVGRRVPEDVSVIGHDNWDFVTGNTDPALTSISNCFEDIGRLAAHRLAEAMDGVPHRGVDYVQCELVVRDSTVANSN